MKRTTLRLIAGLMLGPPALAWGQDAPPPVETPPRPAPEAESESPPGETKALSARVLGVAPGILYVADDSGAAIPLRVTHLTRVGGRRIPRDQAIDASLREAFTAGAPVRATFDVRTHADGTRENVASTVDSP